MTHPLSTRVGIPLAHAALCGQCQQIVNSVYCPWCHSETLPLAPILDRETAEDEIANAQAIMKLFPSQMN